MLWGLCSLNCVDPWQDYLLLISYTLLIIRPYDKLCIILFIILSYIDSFYFAVVAVLWTVLTLDDLIFVPLFANNWLYHYVLNFVTWRVIHVFQFAHTLVTWRLNILLFSYSGCTTLVMSQPFSLIPWFINMSRLIFFYKSNCPSSSSFLY